MRRSTRFREYCWLVLLMGWLDAPLSHADDAPTEWDQITQRAAALSAQYGFEVALAREPYLDRGQGNFYHVYRGYQPTDQARAAVYVAVITESLGRLPADFHKKAGLKRLVLCSELVYCDIKVPGLTNAEIGTIALDTSKVTDDPFQEAFFERTKFFHESFHIFDNQMFSGSGTRAYSDQNWKDLNPAGFLYVTFGGEKSNLGYRETMPGFITSYCRQSVKEDKAVLFEQMVVNPQYVAKRIRQDPILRAKVEYLKTTLRQRQMSMNDSFWKINDETFQQYLINVLR